MTDRMDDASRMVAEGWLRVERARLRELRREEKMIRQNPALPVELEFVQIRRSIQELIVARYEAALHRMTETVRN